MHLALIFIAALAGQIFPGIGAQGSIKTPKAKGAHVVKAVVDQIHGLGIFPDDHKFLCRIAWVESKYGNTRGTYRAKYYGGIWQVSHNTKKLTSLKSQGKFGGNAVFQWNLSKKKTSITLT